MPFENPPPGIPGDSWARFRSRVVVAGPDDCWVWTKGFGPHGYGRIWVKTRWYMALRLAYWWAYDKPPAVLGVLHRCDIPACCNPSHLFLGDQATNNADCKAKGRHAWGFRSGHSKLTSGQVEEIRRAYRRGDGKDLAKKYGVCLQTILNVAKGLAYVPDKSAGPTLEVGHYRGEECRVSVLTESLVREARIRHTAGESVKSLARRFGVSPTAMSSAVKRKTWKHVP
jgi:hypothetical protein